MAALIALCSAVIEATGACHYEQVTRGKGGGGVMQAYKQVTQRWIVFWAGNIKYRCHRCGCYELCRKGGVQVRKVWIGRTGKMTGVLGNEYKTGMIAKGHVRLARNR